MIKKISLIVILGLFPYELTFSASEISICDVVQNRVESGIFPSPADPEEKLFIDGNLFFARYGHNLWSLHSVHEDPIVMFGAGLLLQNNPTQSRSDVLYLFLHGNKYLPITGGGSLVPDQFWKEFIKISGVNMRDFRAVVLLSCYGGSCINRFNNSLPLAAYISAFSGLPVAAPTGLVQIDFRIDVGVRVEQLNFKISDPQAEDYRWIVINASIKNGNSPPNVGGTCPSASLIVDKNCRRARTRGLQHNVGVVLE